MEAEEKNNEEKKDKTPLLSENPIVIEKQKQVADYMNKHSRPIFIGMLILIAISIGLSIFVSLSRKRQDFKPSEVKNHFENSTGREINKFNNLLNDYDNLKEKERKADSLIDYYETMKLTNPR